MELQPQAPSSSSFAVLGIDQSLSGTGISVAKASSSSASLSCSFSSIIDTGKQRGMERIETILTSIKVSIIEHRPSFVAMEDYTRMASSSSIAPLIELMASIKLELHRMGIAPVIQNQSSMKKFAFGAGNTEKDSSYMLKVLDVTGLRFQGDDSADAYLHAWLLAEKVWLYRGVKQLSDFKKYQQEVLMASTMKESKLSQGKFNKLTDAQKLDMWKSSNSFLSVVI